MPELPEVEALARSLDGRLAGRTVTRCELASFSALKTVEPPLSSLVATTVGGCRRRGKFLVLETAAAVLAVHLGRAGWVRTYDRLPAARPKPGRGPIVLRLGTDDGAGLDVTEAGTERRLSLWMADTADDIEPLATLGPDPLDPSFDAAALGRVLAGLSATLKTALTTQSAIAGIGNAYSDEILHAAGLSPYRRAASLDDVEVVMLHAAMVSVLTSAVDGAVGRAASELKGDKHRRLQVHGRGGQVCPVCGDTIRDVYFASRSLQYCPTCQTGGRVLADRRLSRLLR